MSDVFAALGDPTRRRVVEALAAHGSVSASALAREIPVSRQAIAKHLQILREAVLAQPEAAGRETRYHLTPAPLTDAMRWMAATGGRWDERLARLEKRLSAER